MSGQRIEDAEVITRIISAAQRFQPQAAVIECTPITPDVSLRRYFRVRFDGAAVAGAVLRSCVGMWFDSVACPEASGGIKVDSDRAYVELTEFFRHGILVPELYLDARKESILLIEDLGDTPVANLVLPVRTSAGRVERSYKKAIDQIILIQNIPPGGSFAFERAFTADLYEKEMSEFRDFVLTPASAPADVLEAASSLFQHLAGELDALPRTLAHRDFHAWNLYLGPNDEVRVIDFQDAFMATPCYDLVSLLNDRDMDSALGEDLYRTLFLYFLEQKGGSVQLAAQYDRALLQRDLKVAGRFEKISILRGLHSYRRWVPGTLRRIGSTLERISSEPHCPSVYPRALDALCSFVPEIKTGAARRLRLL